MVIRLLLLFALTIPSLLQAEVRIALAQLSPAQNQFPMEKLRQGVDFFFSIVKRECQLNVDYYIEENQSWDLPFSTFNFDGYPQEYSLNDGTQYYFNFFQHNLNEILNASPHSFDSKTLKIFSVPKLDGYCGFAFPTIQFDLGDQYRKNKEIIEKLDNTILINNDQASCGNFSRLLSHEMAHLFIQDNPPHMCQTSSGTLRPCPDDNLLSVFSVAAIAPPFKKPGMFGGGMGGMDGLPRDPTMTQRRPSTGTSLTIDQCQAIKRTVESLDSRSAN